MFLLTFGSVNTVVSISADHQRSELFIDLNQSGSLTASDLVHDNQDNPLSSKYSIALINSHAYYYPQAAFLFELDVCNNESIRGPP
ncbi:MAG: hypothetical protein COB62_07515 [Piscirickettsiaceae bacterium]|nr:MAG: hypothetical protein COB62_07515 [Piscirickettsiaceae bacterium]